ncbi:MAG: response regulator [Chloroflexota bacterium]|nr:response regulator [Chloroflexota bacterium]
MSRTLLVVEDEDTTRRLVAFTLRPLDIQVIDAIDVPSAVEWLREKKPDLILVDISLPVIDGFALMNWLRQTPETQNIPYIAYTARSNPDDELRAYELGAVAFLSKPFSTTELRAIVSRHIGS